MAKNTAEKTKKKIGLSTQIFIALLIGALFGVVIHYWIPSSYIKDTVIVEGVLYVVGQGFIRLMQMLVVPLVFCDLRKYGHRRYQDSGKSWCKNHRILSGNHSPGCMRGPGKCSADQSGPGS